MLHKNCAKGYSIQFIMHKKHKASKKKTLIKFYYLSCKTQCYKNKKKEILYKMIKQNTAFCRKHKRMNKNNFEKKDENRFLMEIFNNMYQLSPDRPTA